MAEDLDAVKLRMAYVDVSLFVHRETMPELIAARIRYQRAKLKRAKTV